MLTFKKITFLCLSVFLSIYSIAQYKLSCRIENYAHREVKVFTLFGICNVFSLSTNIGLLDGEFLPVNAFLGSLLFEPPTYPITRGITGNAHGVTEVNTPANNASRGASHKLSVISFDNVSSH